MKRETPLFIIDTKKSHKKGECDFLVCTDKDNAFVARIDYVNATAPDMGDNPNRTNLRTLMKRGLDYYAEACFMRFNPNSITTEQCVAFLESLINGNKQYLQQAGADFNELETVKSSLLMLATIQAKLRAL